MQLSKYFTLEELTVSDYAARHGMSMAVPQEYLPSLRALCLNVLDPLRQRLGVAVHVTSGYRPPELNRALKGAVSSQHCVGEAADIHVVGLTPYTLAKTIEAMGLPFDQLILEFGQWVHVSHKPIGSQRGEKLTAKHISGHARYFTGLLHP